VTYWLGVLVCLTVIVVAWAVVVVCVVHL